MKKLTTLLASLLLASSTMFGQLANGSTAPNWTLSDINGNSWDLYTLLNQGKTVFIDVSATWCGPCWNYHNTKALDSLYDQHGPAGTKDQMCYVFFIEGDGTTTSADLNGTGTNTQGNWVAGTTFPIIDPAASAINTFNSNYAIGYFPTIYMICPDKKIYEVGQSPLAVLVSSMNTCSFPLDALPAGAPSIACNTNYTPQFTLKNNNTTNAMTSCTVTYKIDGGSNIVYNWSGNLAAGATTVVSLTPVTLTAGTHTLTVTTSNPNGAADNNLNNDMQVYAFSVITAAGVAAPYTQAFAVTTFPYTNWAKENPDGNITWARVTTNTGSLKLDCYNYGSRGAKDAFVVEPIDMTGMTSASLKFDVAHAQYDPTYIEGLEVFVSTDCGSTWTSVYNKVDPALATVAASTAAFTPSTATQWRSECVNLNAYAGAAKIFVKFVSTNDYGNNIYVDNILVSNAACATGINENADKMGLSVYPNPAATQATIKISLAISEKVKVTFYNSLGEQVFTQGYDLPAGDNNVRVSTENLANGMYTVLVSSGNGAYQTKLSIAK